MLATFCELGLGMAFAYFAGKNREFIPELWSLAWVASLLIGGVACLIGEVILPSQLALSETALVGLRLNLVTVPVMLLGGYLGYLLLGAGYLVEFNSVRACSSICYFVGVVAVAVVGASDILLFTIVFILAQFAGCVLAIVLSVLRLHPVWSWQSRLIKPTLNYGLKTYASSLMAQANLRLDQMIMTFVISPTQLGLYVVAVAVSSLVNPVYAAVAVVVLPRVTRASSRLLGGKEAIRHLQYIFLGGVPLTVALCIATPWLLPLLFGDDYQLSILPAQILLVAAFFQGCVITLGNSLRGLGCPEKPAISEGIGLLITIVLLYTLLPIWGILGAAVASLTAYGAVALAQMSFLARESGIRWSDLWRIRMFSNL
jgi:O-antigen/teichoic acid export membrane protein